MFKVLSDQGNANQKDSQIIHYINQSGSYQNLKLQHMLARIWRKRNTLPLLDGSQPGTTTLEINLDDSQKIAERPSNTTHGNIPK